MTLVSLLCLALASFVVVGGREVVLATLHPEFCLTSDLRRPLNSEQGARTVTEEKMKEND